MRRSIFDLRPAPKHKLDDLAAFTQAMGAIGNMMDATYAKLTPKARADAINRKVAQFIAVRTCLRHELP